MQSVDIMIRNGWVLTMSPNNGLIDKGALAVSGDRIVEVGPEAALNKRCEARRIIDARGGIIMPGLVNTHTHAAMTCFRGLADDLPR